MVLRVLTSADVYPRRRSCTRCRSRRWRGRPSLRLTTRLAHVLLCCLSLPLLLRVRELRIGDVRFRCACLRVRSDASRAASCRLHSPDNCCDAARPSIDFDFAHLASILFRIRRCRRGRSTPLSTPRAGTSPTRRARAGVKHFAALFCCVSGFRRLLAPLHGPALAARCALPLHRLWSLVDGNSLYPPC